MNYLRIDPAAPENEAILSQVSKWHNATPKQWIPDYEPTQEDIAQTLIRIKNTKAQDLFLEIAVDERDHPIGFIWGYRQENDDKALMILSLFVVTEYRKLGIASHMKVHLEDWCRKSGIEIIHTTVHYDNYSMLALNQKMGYKAGMVTMAKRL